MKAKTTTKIISMIIMCLFYVSAFAQYNVPADYNSIQNGIDAAQSNGGGTVFVAEGIYYENIIIYDNVFVISENQNPETYIIDSNGAGNIVTFEACINGGIIGFTLKNGGANGQFAGIKIAGDQAPIVAKNIIINSKNGIKIQGDAQPLIVNNTIVNNSDYGILAGGNSPATIINNIIA